MRRERRLPLPRVRQSRFVRDPQPSRHADHRGRLSNRGLLRPPAGALRLWQQHSYLLGHTRAAELGRAVGWHRQVELGLFRHSIGLENLLGDYAVAASAVVAAAITASITAAVTAAAVAAVAIAAAAVAAVSVTAAADDDGSHWWSSS